MLGWSKAESRVHEDSKNAERPLRKGKHVLPSPQLGVDVLLCRCWRVTMFRVAEWWNSHDLVSTTYFVYLSIADIAMRFEGQLENQRWM